MTDPVIIASFPRSGSHWLRYIIEKVTGADTEGQVKQKPDDISVTARMGMGQASGTVVATRVHRLDQWILYSRERKLILLLRDYREVLSRLQQSYSVEELTAWYMNMLVEYDRWKAPKMVVYYETLMKHNADYVRKIITFAFGDQYDPAPFFRHYHAHFEALLSAYRAKYPKHGKNSDTGSRASWDNSVARGEAVDWPRALHLYNSTMFHKYLQTYGNGI